MSLILSRDMFSKGLLPFIVRCKKCHFRNVLNLCGSKRLVSSKNLSHTTILLQNGLDIQEIPLIVKKISRSEASQVLFGENCDPSVDGIISSDNIASIPRKEEIEEIVEGFKRCNSIHEILKLLEVVPSTYVEPTVAFYIVKKMVELDHIYSIVGEGAGEDVSKNFTKTAVFNQLMSIVLSNDDCSVLIQCLKLICQHSAFRKYFQPYEQHLYELIFINVTQNKFTLSEICVIIEEFYKFGNPHDVDKLWVGITENYKYIDQHNIMQVFHVLPCFKKSYNVVFKTLLQKIADIWWYMDGKSICEILAIIKMRKTYSYDLLQILGRWLNTQIHSVSEEDLILIIDGFKELDFVNSEVISALERYVKIRIDMIKNVSLLSSIMNYCVRFHIRSSLIFDKVCDYFIANGSSLSPAIVTSLFVPFGYLNFNPTRSYEFWKKFEEILKEKFVYFNPEHLVEIMLSCIYLERYPINFTNLIFNPYFLNNLQTSSKNWTLIKQNLILFDHMMSCECQAYEGPLLPRKFYSTNNLYDKRIQVMWSKLLKDVFESIGESKYFIMCNKYIKQCNFHHNCKVDVLLLPKSNNLSFSIDKQDYKDPIIAVLLHMPEHYSYNGDILIGSEMMRKRHLSNIGLQVISLNYLYLVSLLNGPNPKHKLKELVQNIIHKKVNI